MQYGWFALCYVMGLNPNLVPHPEASRVLGAVVSLLMTSVEDMHTFVKSADILPGVCALPWNSAVCVPRLCWVGVARRVGAQHWQCHSMQNASASCCRLPPSPALARLFQALGEAENACETDGPRQQASRAKLLVGAPPLDMTPVHGMAAEHICFQEGCNA